MMALNLLPRLMDAFPTDEGLSAYNVLSGLDALG